MKLARNTAIRLEENFLGAKRNHTSQEFLDRYSDVFRDELGTMKGVTAKIHLGPKASYSTIPQSQISPFPLTNWNDFRSRASLSYPVQFSEWAAPIVPVVKSDGKICGYKVTIN